VKKFFSLCFCCLFGFAACKDTPLEADRFGIYVSDLSGSNTHAIALNSWQQMSHPRVSPDGKLVTFTRYNKKRSGLAQEIDGYEETEIMLMNIDGSNMWTIVPPKPDVLNCNSSWAEDGKSLLWVSTDNERHFPSIMKIELETRQISRIPTPVDLKTSDPHSVGTKMIFPVLGKVDALWTMNFDGTGLEQVTHPSDRGGFRWFALPVGDYDPKLSPDGKRAAFMRLVDKDDWQIIVLDLETKKETNASGEHAFDIVPDWSSDGKLLMFSHIDVKRPKDIGIYVSRPDGSERRMLPLPRGLLPNQPHFFPGDGSGPNARLIYQAFKAPGLP